MAPSADHYNRVAMSLHWLIAFAILANLAMGLVMDDMANGPLKFELYQWHKSIGVSVLVLSLMRLAWRFVKPPPPLPDTLRPWEKMIANTVYVFFYLLMIGLPVSGWALVSASPLNLPTVLFGIVPLPHLPFFEAVPDRKALAGRIGDVHAIFAFSMIGLLGLHVAAVIRHHWLLRDRTLLRMMPSVLHGPLNALRDEK